MRLTPWWTIILQSLDADLNEERLDAALVLLNVPFEDQKKLEEEFTKLSQSARRNRHESPRTWVEFLTIPAERQFCVSLYPYLTKYHGTRDAVIDDFLKQDTAQQSRRAVCIAVNLDRGDTPYSVVALSPQPDLFDRL